MFKSVSKEVWAFDAEWVPDPEAGRLLYDLPDSMSDRDVLTEMWQRNGATDENPRPYLKTVLCRVVSIAAVIRQVQDDGSVNLDLRCQPRDVATPTDCDESTMLFRFLESIARRNAQLVGYNSGGSDLPIFVQRAIVKGIAARGFCTRPDKPWEGRDYFVRFGESHVDLMNVVNAWRGGSRAVPTLDTLATLSGIPGKMGFDGSMTAESWLEGDLARIVRYNQHDALTTYLVWLRVAHFGGHFSDAEYREEEDRLRELLAQRCQGPENQHLQDYLNEWNRLRARTADS